MTAGTERAAWLVASMLVVGAAPEVLAQPSATSAAATLQFDKGRALMKEKKYAEACAAFEASQKLDPQFGTQFNLAGCYVHVGKLASAWLTFRELEQRDTNAGRAKASGRQAKALEARLPKLVIQAKPVPGLVVKLDGADVTALLGTEAPIDLGDHTIEATAPGMKPVRMTQKITQEGKLETVAIELAPPTAPAEPQPLPPGPPQPEERSDEVDEGPTDAPRSTRKRTAIIVGASGGALVITGLVFGRMASSKWSEAKELCGDDLMCDDSMQLERGNQLVDDARLRANVSTGLVIGGVAAIGVGAFLFLTAPSATDTTSTAWRVTPSASPQSVGVSLDTRF